MHQRPGCKSCTWDAKVADGAAVAPVLPGEAATGDMPFDGLLANRESSAVSGIEPLNGVRSRLAGGRGRQIQGRARNLYASLAGVRCLHFVAREWAAIT
jgi:hypothetical protein